MPLNHKDKTGTDVTLKQIKGDANETKMRWEWKIDERFDDDYFTIMKYHAELGKEMSKKLYLTAPDLDRDVTIEEKMSKRAFF